MNQVTLKLISAVQSLAQARSTIEQRAKKLEIADCFLALLGFPEAAGATLWPEAPRKMPRPSLAEVQLFCAKSGILPRDAEWFFHKMEGNGWTNGGKAIKRWGSTLVAWKVAGHLPSQRQPPGQFNGAALQAPVGINEIRKDVDRLHQQIKREEENL